MGRSETVTDGIRVRVQSFYVPERSAPQRNLYYFAYQIRISNEGPAPARLVSRHWVITDGNGAVEEVRGPGVVGESPRLERGETFEYTSACPLPTPLGSMHGRYHMIRDDGLSFDAEIAPFALELPHSLN